MFLKSTPEMPEQAQ